MVPAAGLGGRLRLGAALAARDELADRFVLPAEIRPVVDGQPRLAQGLGACPAGPIGPIAPGKFAHSAPPEVKTLVSHCTRHLLAYRLCLRLRTTRPTGLFPKGFRRSGWGLGRGGPS